MLEAHLAEVLADLDRLLPRAERLLAGVDDAQLAAVPPGGGWSVAQIFEHLCRADSSYVDEAIPRAIQKARGRAPPPRPWRASLMGGWLRRLLADLGRRLPAPAPYRVPDRARPDVVGAWRAGVGRLRALVEAAEGLDLNTRLSSPVAPCVRINLGDALAIPVVHGHRHLAQVERTLRRLRA